MSHEIIQSTKVYQVRDSKGNSAYISGTVSESNNVSPKRYDTIYFHVAAKDILTMHLEAVQYAHSIISGGVVLKNGEGKSIEDDIDTIVRRFTRNVRLAKIIDVESVHYDAGRVKITWGDEGFKELSNHEAKFGFYHTQRETLNIRVMEATDELRSAYDFLHSSRSIEQAIKISKHDRSLGAFFYPAEVTKEQLTSLIQNSCGWVYRHIASRTTTRLTTEEFEASLSLEAKEEYSKSSYTRSNATYLISDDTNRITIQKVKAKLKNFSVNVEGRDFHALFVYLVNEVNGDDPGLADEIVQKATNYGSVGLWVEGKRVTVEKKYEQE